MNKRIKELARQAYIEARLDENPKWRESFVSEAAMNEIQSTMEKFAELIVRECILTIQMGITRDGHNTEKYLRSMKHIKQIKEHFGVKE